MRCHMLVSARLLKLSHAGVCLWGPHLPSNATVLQAHALTLIDTWSGSTRTANRLNAGAPRRLGASTRPFACENRGLQQGENIIIIIIIIIIIHLRRNS
jgi:hypothetical protein